MRLSCCLLLWGVGAIGGCGGIAYDGSLVGHDAGDGGHEHDSATDAGDSGDGPDSAVDLCAPVAGIGLCGSACAGSGGGCAGRCVAAIPRVGEASVGLCASDLPAPIESCWMCEDGSACANLDGEGYVCVPEAVCRRLFALGAGSACVYSDFSEYDGRPLALATGSECPAKACGPGCGGCTSAARCTGRSADYGYGFCVGGTFAEWCEPSDARRTGCDGCATWTSSSLAEAYGRCARTENCDAWEPTGRVDCHR